MSGVEHAVDTMPMWLKPTDPLPRLPDGETVYAIGDHPARRITQRFTQPTRILGLGATFAGLRIEGAANLIVDGLEVSNPGGTGVRVRGSENVVLHNLRVHDCRRGIDGPGGISDKTRGVTIAYCTVERLTEDAVAFGDWSDVTISDCTLREMRDPAGVLHNDGVQLFGNVHGLRVLRNRIEGSRSQGMLLQAAVGPNSDILVAGNTVDDVGGVAVQADACPGLVVRDNPLIRGRLGSLWVWPKADVNDVAVTGNGLSHPWQRKSPAVNVVDDEANLLLHAE